MYYSPSFGLIQTLENSGFRRSTVTDSRGLKALGTLAYAQPDILAGARIVPAEAHATDLALSVHQESGCSVVLRRKYAWRTERANPVACR